MIKKSKYLAPILITLFYAGLPFAGMFIPIAIYKDKEKLQLKENIKYLAIFAPLWFVWFAPRYRFSAYLIATLIGLAVWSSILFLSSRISANKFPFLFTLIYYLFAPTKIGSFWLNLEASFLSKSFILPIVGIGGTNLLILTLGIILYHYVNCKNNNKKLKLFLIITIILLILLIPPFTNNTSNTEIKIAGIQGNLIQNYYQRQELKNSNANLYLNLSKMTLKEKPKIIIWPEYVFTHAIQWDYPLLDKITSFSLKNNITLIFGANSFDAKHRYDSAFIINKKNITIYRSQYIVPFIDKDSKTIKKPNKIIVDNTSIGIAICYEENIPRVFIKEINENNASLFIVLGNLYKMGPIGLRTLSLNIRDIAAVTNRYIIRIENVGITEIIDNKGNIIKKIPIGKKGVIEYSVPVIKTKTFYVKNYKKINFSILTISFLFLALL